MDLVSGEFEGCWLGAGGALVYREIPKAACSTLAQLIFHADHGRFFDGDIHDAEEGVMRWPFDPVLMRAAQAGQAFVFSALRNPFARIVSAFQDKICGLQRDGLPYRGILQQMLWERYGVDLHPDADRVAAFRRFMLFVRDVHLTGPVFWQDRHWTPQAQHLRSLTLNGVRFSHLFRIEEFASGVAPVLARVAPDLRPGQLPRFNQSAPLAVPLDCCFDDLTLHLMQEVYRWDFELFGYDRFDPSGACVELDLDMINLRLSDPFAPHWSGLVP